MISEYFYLSKYASGFVIKQWTFAFSDVSLILASTNNQSWDLGQYPYILDLNWRSSSNCMFRKAKISYLKKEKMGNMTEVQKGKDEANWKPTHTFLCVDFTILIKLCFSQDRNNVSLQTQKFQSKMGKYHSPPINWRNLWDCLRSSRRQMRTHKIKL
jgi:hypothetical protein